MALGRGLTCPHRRPAARRTRGYGPGRASGTPARSTSTATPTNPFAPADPFATARKQAGKQTSPKAAAENKCSQQSGLLDRIQQNFDPLTRMGCAAAQFVSGWWVMLGKAVTNTSEFRPDDAGFRSLYGNLLMLGLFALTGALLWHVGVVTPTRGGSPALAAPLVFARYARAVILALYIPALAFLAEFWVIQPITTAIIGNQGATIRHYAESIMPVLMSTDLPGGIATTIFYGIFAGVGALAVWVMMDVRAIGLEVLIVFVPLLLAATLGERGWDKIREPAKFAGALFLMKPIVAVLVLLGLRMMNVAGQTAAGAISTLVTGFAIVLASLFAFWGIASVIGAGGNHLVAASNLRHQLRGPGLRTPAFMPTPSEVARQRILSNAQGHRSAGASQAGVRGGSNPQGPGNGSAGGRGGGPTGGAGNPATRTAGAGSAGRAGAAGAAGTAGSAAATGAAAAAGPVGVGVATAGKTAAGAASAPRRAGEGAGKTVNRNLPPPRTAPPSTPPTRNRPDWRNR